MELTVSMDNVRSSVEVDSVVAVELERRVLDSAGMTDSSPTALSTGEVKREMLATRWVVGMRERKVWVGLDILAAWVGRGVESVFDRLLK